MKNLTYKRPSGIVGGQPRDWIDRNLPACPFCHTTNPKWEQAVERSMKLSLFHYRCPRCQGDLTIPVDAVVPGSGLVSGAMVHGPIAQIFRINSVGTSGSTLPLDKEITPEELRNLIKRDRGES